MVNPVEGARLARGGGEVVDLDALGGERAARRPAGAAERRDAHVRADVAQRGRERDQLGLGPAAAQAADQLEDPDGRNRSRTAVS